MNKIQLMALHCMLTNGDVSVAKEFVREHLEFAAMREIEKAVEIFDVYGQFAPPEYVKSSVRSIEGVDRRHYPSSVGRLLDKMAVK